jgi:hypothetical protein
MKKIFSFIPFGKEEWLELFYLYKLQVSAVLLILVGAIAFFSVRFSKDDSADYYALDLAYTEWTEHSKEKPKLLETIEKGLQAHPELHARYDAKLTQRLIERDQGTLVDRYASRLLEQKNLDRSCYGQFANLSLMIAKGNFSEALEESVKLKELMEHEKWEGTTLYAYQLLRIALLQQQIGTPQEELLAWRDLMQKKGDEILEPYFRDHKLVLKDYVHYRIQKNT